MSQEDHTIAKKGRIQVLRQWHRLEDVRVGVDLGLGWMQDPSAISLSSPVTGALTQQGRTLLHAIGLLRYDPTARCPLVLCRSMFGMLGRHHHCGPSE